MGPFLIFWGQGIKIIIVVNSRPNLRSIQQRTCMQFFLKLAHYYYAGFYSNNKIQMILKFTLILLLLTFMKEFLNNFALFNSRFCLSIHEMRRCSGVLFITEVSKATDRYYVTRYIWNNITLHDTSFNVSNVYLKVLIYTGKQAVKYDNFSSDKIIFNYSK